MRNRLLIGFAALLVCATNALAQRQQVTTGRFACSDFDCDDNADCQKIGCGTCSKTPKLQSRCTAAG